MKTLSHFGELKFGLFFNLLTENRKIADWVASNLNQFNLNEPHSCTVDLAVGGVISISGDEDSVELLITEIEPII